MSGAWDRQPHGNVVLPLCPPGGGYGPGGGCRPSAGKGGQGNGNLLTPPEDSQPARAPLITFSALEPGEDVDVFLGYTQDASSGVLHASINETNGWTRASVMEAWEIRNFNPRDSKTWVKIQRSHQIWHGRSSGSDAPGAVTQRVPPEHVRRCHAPSETPSPSSAESSSGSEEDSEMEQRPLRRPSLWRPTGGCTAEPGTPSAWVSPSPAGGARSGVPPCTSGRLCKRHQFYGKYPLQGAGLFCKIQEAIDDGEDVQLALDELALRGIEDEAWTATYTAAKNTATTRIHLMHLAASLGSVKVMERILSRFGPEIVNRKSMIKADKSQTYEPHYTPLMSAMFMSQVDAVIWLLDKNADAASANHDGFTPLHMLALYGMPHVRSDGRLRAMQMVSAKLVERRADLAAPSGALEHWTGADAECKRRKRPLEIAALKTCAYPKEMLHLLTTSYQCPEQSKLFEEVHIIAKANPSGAETLMENFKANVTGQLKERLIQEVEEAAEDGEHIDMLSSILRMSPVAGAELLGLLLCEPKVCDPHLYPLPLYNYLPNRVMRCTYQWVLHWDKGNKGTAAPEWHKDFVKELPGDPLRHDNVYEVKVRVLRFPGVLNLQLLSIVSRVWHYGHHMRIFAQLPVQAIITCLWSRSRRTFWFMFFRELATLLVLLFLGINPLEEDHVVHRLSHVIIGSELLCELWGLTSGLSVCHWLAGMPRMTYFWEFHLPGFLQSLLLLMLVWVSFPINTAEEKVVCAVNIMMSCYQVIAKLRTVPDLGPLIIAVLRSFAPMRNMFLVMFMVFIVFFFAFATIKDKDRSFWYVSVYLYRALFLDDGDATLGLSGFDYGQEQKLDFGDDHEQFTGGDSQLILHFSSILMIMATLLFSIVLLNLVIGMYSKFYDEMRHRAELLFHQQRAKACVTYLLSPGFLHLALGESLKQYKTRFFVSAAACVLMSGGLLLLPAELWRLSTLALTVGLQLLQAALVTYICDPELAGKYLWVSYRSDYSKEFYLDQTNQELIKVRRQLSRCATQAELSEVKRLIKRIERALMASCPVPQTYSKSQ